MTKFNAQSSQYTKNTTTKEENIKIDTKLITLIAIKTKRLIELWQGNRFVKSYPFTAFSGKLGPKLKEGDLQIPEGIYKVEYLNPNSKFHLSFKINYPNEFDLKMAQLDGRTELGGEIFIHGKDVTIGCIPIGDAAIEDLYEKIETNGIENTKVIISPIDFRSTTLEVPPTNPAWLKTLYANIENELKDYCRN